MAGNQFLGKIVDTLWVKNFVEIALSRTLSEINVLLGFTQKFKMATKKMGKNDFWETSSVCSAENLRVKNLVEIALCLTFPRYMPF